MPLPVVPPIFGIAKALWTLLPIGRDKSQSDKAVAATALKANNGTVTTLLAALVGGGGVVAYASMDEAIFSIAMVILSLVLYLVNQNAD